ncbi:MAG: serine hydrolase domain-containing protein [bacterium]
MSVNPLFAGILSILAALPLWAAQPVPAAQFVRPAGAAEMAEVAAGYQALFTCSAYFIARRALADIIRVELVDMTEFDLPQPDIDTRRQLVRAGDGKGFTAIAAYRAGVGCTLLPPTWTEADVGRLPYISLPEPPATENTDFPYGDKADVKPSRQARALLNQAFDGQTFGDNTVTVGIVIVHKGKLVAEQYRQGFGIHSGYRTWSTAKSISASLMGIAVKDGLIDITAPANIPEWRFFNDPRQAITYEHLLHMSSGLYSQGANTNALYFGGQDVISSATSTHLEIAPNTRWKYANNDTLLLLRGLRATLNNDLDYFRYPYDRLFHRIGMYHTHMEMDHQGNFIGSSQVYTTARDLARFGLLHLNKGVWKGQQILPVGWTEYIADPAPALPRAAGERGYGGQFWLLDSLPGVPEGTYTSAGNKGQFVTIVPSSDLVIVRTGVDPNGSTWMQDKFIGAAVDVFGNR